MTQEFSSSKDELIGTKARQVRQAARLSLQDAASNLSISVDQLRDFETGQARIPSTMLVDMAKLYRFELSDFFPKFLEPREETSSQDHCNELADLKLACIESVLATDNKEALRGSLLMLQKKNA